MSEGRNGKKVADERDETRRRRVAPVVLLTIALSATAGAAVSARGWLTPRPELAKVGAPEGKMKDDPPLLPADVTLTTLDSSGFTPSEITHEAGRFRIVVQNRSGEAVLDLRLDGEGSSRFNERHVLGDVQGWTAEVDLAAGTYTITEAHHQDWSCRLTVQ